MSPYTMPGVPSEDREKSARDISIIQAICEYRNQQLSELQGRHRPPDKVYTRQLICYFLLLYTNLSQLDIAKKFGGTDHTRSRRSAKQIYDQAPLYDDIGKDVHSLTEKIHSLGFEPTKNAAFLSSQGKRRA